VTVVKVEVGFSGPGVDESFKLDSATRGLLGTARLGPFDTLVDLSERVRSLSVSRGRPELTEPVTVGRAQILLDNLDGALDPQNTSSVLYPGVQPRRSVRLFCDDEQVFDGFAETIALDYTLDGDATVVVSAQDGLSRLGIVNLPSEGLAVSSEGSGARISSVLASNANYWTELGRILLLGIRRWRQGRRRGTCFSICGRWKVRRRGCFSRRGRAT
jgi:hypothetical protein